MQYLLKKGVWWNLHASFINKTTCFIKTYKILFNNQIVNKKHIFDAIYLFLTVSATFKAQVFPIICPRVGEYLHIWVIMLNQIEPDIGISLLIYLRMTTNSQFQQLCGRRN